MLKAKKTTVKKATTEGLAHIHEIMAGKVKVPYHRTLKITFEDASRGHVVLKMPLKKHIHASSREFAHGGSIASLIDAAAGYAFYTTLLAGKKPVMSNLTVDFRGKALLDETPLIATARVVNKMRSSGVVDVIVKQGRKTIALGRGTAVIAKEDNTLG